MLPLKQGSLDRLENKYRAMEKAEKKLIGILKNMLGVVFLLLMAVFIALIIIVCIAIPDIPKISGTNPNLESPTVLYDLSVISHYYDADFLTYAGQVKGYSLWKLSRIGITLSDDMKDYHLRYEMFKDSVNDFIVNSDTTMLHMKMSPTEFKAALNVLTKESRQ